MQSDKLVKKIPEPAAYQTMSVGSPGTALLAVNALIQERDSKRQAKLNSDSGGCVVMLGLEDLGEPTFVPISKQTHVD
jgi:hypothetical protein